jgi:LPXTG-motif cell wall-anchored protein
MAAAPTAPTLAQEAVEEEAVEEEAIKEGVDEEEAVKEEVDEEGAAKEGDTKREAAREGATQADKATLSFELTVEGDPPAATAFYGHVHTGEGGPGLYVPLTDPDKDRLYTGSTSVDRFGPGPRPVPPGVEPVSLPVRIVQDSEVIKDFGTVKLDGDKTFSASVSFDDEEPNPEEVSATGRIVEIADYPVASHAIIDEASGVRYLLTSDGVDLQDYAVSGERVIVYGTPVPNRYTTETILDVTRVERAGTPPPDNSGSDNGGSGNDGSGSRGGSSDGGVASGIRGLLPNTGGSMALTLLGAGVLMTGGGLLVRRTFR